MICIRTDGQDGQTAAASAHDDGTSPISRPEVIKRLEVNNMAERYKDAFAEGSAAVLKRIQAVQPRKTQRPWRPRFTPPPLTLKSNVAAKQNRGCTSQRKKGPPVVRWRSNNRERVTLGRDGAPTEGHTPVIRFSEEHVLHPDNDP